MQALKIAEGLAAVRCNPGTLIQINRNEKLRKNEKVIVRQSVTTGF